MPQRPRPPPRLFNVQGGSSTTTTRALHWRSPKILGIRDGPGLDTCYAVFCNNCRSADPETLPAMRSAGPVDRSPAVCVLHGQRSLVLDQDAQRLLVAVVTRAMYRGGAICNRKGIVWLFPSAKHCSAPYQVRNSTEHAFHTCGIQIWNSIQQRNALYTCTCQVGNSIQQRNALYTCTCQAGNSITSHLCLSGRELQACATD